MLPAGGITLFVCQERTTKHEIFNHELHEFNEFFLCFRVPA